MMCDTIEQPVAQHEAGRNAANVGEEVAESLLPLPIPLNKLSLFERVKRLFSLRKAPDVTNGPPANFGPRSVGAGQNPAGIVSGNLKTLKTSQLSRAGVDAEAAKAADLGRDARSFNISVDDAGNVFYVPVRKGASDTIPAFRTLDDLAEEFPLNRR
jgi:hypothetical protein